MRRALDLLDQDRVRLSRERSLQELRQDLLRASYRPGDYDLPHGVRSSGYFDKYRFTTRPAILRRLGRFLAALVPPGTDRLAAPALGAVMLGAAVSLESGLPVAVVRSGRDAQRPDVEAIEGGVYRGEHVVLIEDVVVTGRRARGAVERLLEAGADVTTVIAVIDGLAGARELLADVDYRPLLSVADLGLPDDVFRRPSGPRASAGDPHAGGEGPRVSAGQRSTADRPRADGQHGEPA